MTDTNKDYCDKCWMFIRDKPRHGCRKDPDNLRNHLTSTLDDMADEMFEIGVTKRDFLWAVQQYAAQGLKEFENPKSLVESVREFEAAKKQQKRATPDV